MIVTLSALSGVTLDTAWQVGFENAGIAWSQTSHAERARQAAVPAVLSIGLEDPGGGQSDIAAPVFLAYERYLDVADAVVASLATLSIAVIQAFRLSRRLPPPHLAELHAALDARVPPFDQDGVGELGPPREN